MTSSSKSPAGKISAVVSDVDGTLVTDDKMLTARAQAAVAKLHARGIAFTIVSSRPPRGLRKLLQPLGITKPFGSFNGGMIARPDLSVITEHLLSPEVARRAVAALDARGVQSWVFAGDDWLVRVADGPYVAREQRAVEFPPTVVEDFGTALDNAAKIVGVSADFEFLARCDPEVRAALSGRASVVRSQQYYLDITHPLANKGDALLELSRLLSVPLAEIAVIGDGGNDIAMFAHAGLSIAMRNGSPDVQRAAGVVTGSNGEEGFAEAVDRFILGGDRSGARSHVEQAGRPAW